MTVTKANGIDFALNYVGWNTLQVRLDRTLGEWRNGSWFVQLIPQSEPGRDDLFRICWHTNLPDWGLKGVGSEPAVLVPAGPPVLRLSCAVHRKQDGLDVGGFIADDVSGQVTTYKGEW